jgi:hypothetical protein
MSRIIIRYWRPQGRKPVLSWVDVRLLLLSSTFVIEDILGHMTNRCLSRGAVSLLSETVMYRLSPPPFYLAVGDSWHVCV